MITTRVGALGASCLLTLALAAAEPPMADDVVRLVAPDPRFAPGVCGLCLLGVDGPGGADVLASLIPAPYPQLRLPMAEAGRRLFPPDAGTIALWIRHGSAHFHGTEFLIDQDHSFFAADRDKVRVTIVPVGDARPAQRGRVRVAALAADGTETAISGGEMVPGAWHHLAITWRGDGMTLFQDGRRVAAATWRVPPDVGRARAMWLRSGDYMMKPFAGDLDRVVFLPAAIGATEAAALAAPAGSDRAEERASLVLDCDGDLSYRHRPVAWRPPPVARIALASGRLGYHPCDTPVAAEVEIPAGVGEAEAELRLEALDGTVVAERRERIPSAAHAAGPRRLAGLDAGGRCGLHWLRVDLREPATGRTLGAASLPLAFHLPLPPAAELPDSHPLGGQPVSVPGNGIEEGPVLGLKWDRLFCYETKWYQLEPRRGEYAWSALDHYVERAERAGLRPYLCLHGTPDWATSAPPDRELHRLFLAAKGAKADLLGMAEMRRQYVPRAPSMLADFCRAVVRRYRGRIRHWEVWNEPSPIPGYLRTVGGRREDQLAAYAILLEAASAAIHAEDPDSKVIGLNVAPDIAEHVEAMLAAGARSFDILAIHDYNYDTPVRWAERRGTERAAEACRRHLGRVPPIWNTECAFSQPAREGERPMDEARFAALHGLRLLKYRDGVSMTTEHRAACYTVQSTLLSLAAGTEKVVYHGHAGPSVLSPLSPIRRLPTEQGVALAALSHALAGFAGCYRLPLPGIPDAGAVAIARPGGGRTLVVFADVATALPLRSGAAAPVARDMLGNPLALRAEDGLTVVQAGREPLYIDDPAGSLEPALPLALRLDVAACEPGAAVTASAVLVNHASRARRFELAVVAPVGWEAAIAPAVELAPGATTTLPLCIAARGSGRSIGRIAVQTRCANIAAGSAAVDVENLGIMRAVPAVPAVAAVFAAATAERVTMGALNPMQPQAPHWSGPEDASFTIAVAWSPDGLQVRAEVIDDRVESPERPARGLWHYDCVELFVDGRDDAQRGRSDGLALAPGVEHINILAPRSSEPASCVVAFKSAQPTLSADFRGWRTARGYVVEGRMAPVAGSMLRLAPGTRLAFDAAVDDCDDVSWGRKSQITVFGSDRNYLDSSRWARLCLAPADR